MQLILRSTLFILLFWPLACWSQDQVLRGRIVDSQSGAGLAFAHILQKGTANGTVADENGSFRLEVPELPLTLVITEVAHRTREIEVDQAFVEIHLDPLRLELADVVISREMEAYSRLTNQVKDFEFYDELLLVLGTSGQELRLINQGGGLVYRSLTPVKGRELFSDCLGNIHLLGQDSAYQIFYDYEYLHFLDPYPLEEFDRYLRDCHCQFDGGLILVKHSRRGLQTSVLHARGGLTRSLAEMADSNALDYLNREYGLEYFVERRNNGDHRYHFSRATMADSLEYLQDELELDWFDQRILQPGKIFAAVWQDSLRIFDLDRMQQLVYTPGGERAVTTTLSYTAKNARALLRDRVTGQLYIDYARRGQSRLQNVFEAGDSMNISEMPFPSKLKLYNGLLYFISNPDLDGGYYLFRKNRVAGEDY